eukprot:15249400-Ditylum_brightwellii.AAC.1
MHWMICCDHALSVLKDVPFGSCPIVRSKTVMEWFVQFRTNGWRFVVPSVSMKNVDKLPLIFSVYPDFKEACTDFIDNYIGNMSDKTVHRFMNQCLKAIVNHDTMFIEDDDSDSKDESEYRVESATEENERSLIDRFNEISLSMTPTNGQEKEKTTNSEGFNKF